MAKSARTANPHEAALSARHAELEARLATETMRPSPNPGVMSQLKKAKLRIKDALTSASV